MKCVILAAGTSSRMRPISGGLPKPLIRVGGKPILQRTIENVLIAGATEIGIVLGYKAAEIRTFVKENFPFHKIRFIVNPKFEATNNAFSLLLAREFYKSETKPHSLLQQLLLLDSDIVFSSRLLPFLMSQTTSSVLAVRVKGSHNEEEIRVKVDGAKRVLKIGKDVPLAETYGESIGIEVFSPPTAELLFQTLDKRVKQGIGRTEFYEASFQELIDGGKHLHAVDVSDFPAAEIDTLEDLEFVRKSILPRLA